MRFIPSAVQLVLLPGKETFYYSSKLVIAGEGESNRCLYIDLVLGDARDARELGLLQSCRFDTEMQMATAVFLLSLYTFTSFLSLYTLVGISGSVPSQSAPAVSETWTLSKASSLGIEFKILGNFIRL